MLALTLSATFVSAATLSTIIRLTTYGVTCAALPVLRRKRTGGPGVFVTPGGPVVAVAALVVIGWLFSNSAWTDARQVLIAAAAGFVLCVAFDSQRRRTGVPLDVVSS